MEAYEMGTQTLVLVLCALVFTTFGHEVQNRRKALHHTTDRAKHVAQHRCPLHSNPKAPASGQPVAPNGCKSKKMLIYVTPETSLIGALNATADGLAIVFDVNGGFTAGFHGSTGAVIIYNVESAVGTFVRADRVTIHNLASRPEVFEKYFKSLRSLRPLWEHGLQVGEQFKLGHVSYEVSLHLQFMVSSLGAGAHSATRTEAIHHINTMASILLNDLRGPLRGFLNILGDSVRTITVSLRTAIARIQTLSDVVAKSGRGVNIVRNLNYEVFFNEASPIQLFISMFSTFKEENVDIASVLRDYSPNFTVFLATLAGNSTVGLNGVLRIIGEMKGMYLGTSVINGFVPVLVEYFRNTGINPINLQQLKRESLDFLAFVEKQGLASELQPVVNFFRGLVQNRFIFNGANVFKIVQILLEPRAAPLHNLVRVLNEIEGLIKIEVSTGLLIYYLAQLAVDNSVSDVHAVIPSLTLDHSVDTAEFIFRGAKISELPDNLYRFLLHRPVFGLILTVIDSGCDDISLEDLFKTTDFAPFGRAITRLLVKTFLSVKRQAQYDSQEVIHHGNENQMRSHSRIKARHLDVSNKKHKVDKQHGHERRHNKEKHHGHGKHHIKLEHGKQLGRSLGKHHAHGKREHHQKRGPGKHHVHGHARKHSHKEKHRT